MNILIIARYCLSTKGDGVGDYSYNLAKELAKRDVGVKILTSKYNVVNLEKTQDNLEILQVIESWKITGLKRIIKEVKLLNLDIINLQYVPYMYGRIGINFTMPLLPFMLKFFLNKNTIVTCHELFIDWSFTPKKFIIALIQRIQFFILLFGSKKIISVTNKHTKKIKRYNKLFNKEIITIPVGSNIEVVNVSEIWKNRVHSELNIEDNFIMAIFGLLHPLSNVEVVFYALKTLLQNNYKVKLMCIGDMERSNPGYFKMLKIMENEMNLNENIIWTGYLKDKDVSLYLSVTDLVIFPRKYGVDLHSGSLIAALSHGLPVIAVKGDNLDESLNNSAIIFFSPNDSNELAQKIEDLIIDKDLRYKLGKQNKIFYENNLTWPKIANQILTASME